MSFVKGSLKIFGAKDYSLMALQTREMITVFLEKENLFRSFGVCSVLLGRLVIIDDQSGIREH